ncbi:c-type cytochrome biogenesis protein CcmI, partial [Salipiger sp. HF18]|uniref:c-type cytochrome biogenesis protein CcmI n=1 Tax=Salipiger sp. HF18 TaxID=2721557 RepID=UPI00142DA635
MTVFWIIAGATALLVAALLVAALLRGRRETGPAEAWDLQVYRDQLREIERDAARGAIAPDEAERLKTEVSRRILAADAKIRGGKPAAPRASGPAMVMGTLIVLVLLGGGMGLYWQ